MFFLTSCDDVIKSNIPEVRVDFQANATASPYYRLQTPGDFFIVDSYNNGIVLGYAGLILGHSYWSDIGYVAYDRACPIEASRTVKLSIVEDDEDFLGEKIAKCSECGTRFRLNNGGSPVSEEKLPWLKSYQIFVSSDKVRIYN